jgi:zinc transport system substrate-binding protein
MITRRMIYALLTMIVICGESSAMRKATVAALALVLAAGGCGAHQRPSGGPVGVVAGFYPLQYVAEQVGGDRVRVTNLAQPGAEPHDLELSPHQLASVADAGVVIYLPGFQASLDEAVAQEAPARAFDALSTVPLLTDNGGRDPHVWLDPTRLATIATALADRLAAVDPAGAAGYHARAAELGDRLADLDQEYATALRSCERRDIVVSHAAFGYLADRYELRQVPVAGLSPEVEPTPRKLAAATQTARDSGATTIFFESLVSPAVARVVADSVGATTAVLDPIEGLEPGATGDYLSVMRDNLATLGPALGCA